jgi:gliding motility-associated-like protein
MASPQTTTTYTLRAFTGICPSLPSDILVIVHDVPAPNAGSDTILCSNADSLIMQGAFTGGTAPYVTTWYPSTGLDATTIPNPKGLPNTSTMYYFTVSCGTGVSFCSATDSVLVTIKPGVFATLEADTNIICPGENVNLKAIGGQGSATFQWSPSTGLNNALTPYPVATPDTTTNYNVFISEGGCADTATVRIQVHPKPEAGFVQSQPSGCSPVMIQFNNRSANALSHTWSFGDGSPLNNELNPKHTYTQAGTYQVQLIVKGIGGCTDTLIGDLPVTITDRLVADFTSDPTSPVEMANPASEVFFRDKSIGASSWYWDFGDGKVANTQNPSHRYQAPGKYTVTLRAKNDAGCEGVVTKGPYVVFEPELFVPNVFSPNGDGVNDFFVLKYDGDESFHIQIYDRWGVKYFDTHNKTQHWNGQDLNGQAAAEGTYFYSVTVGNRSYSGTVNVMR